MPCSVDTYLPRLLREWYRNHPGKLHRESEHCGLLIFADASGFTALTRALGEQGPVGFEILTNLLNGLFRRLDQVIASHGGDLLKFSGDAVWCWFPHGTDPHRIFAAMLAQVEELNRSESVCALHPLSLHAGAIVGILTIFSIHASDVRFDYEIAGPDIGRAYAAADQAGQGELVIAESDARAAGNDSPEADVDSFTPSESTFQAANPLERYVPEAIRERQVDQHNLTDLNSEHRRVSVLFVLVTATNTEKSGSEVANRLARIMATISSHTGMVARIDPFKSGHKVLCLFGATQSAGLNELRAIRAAVEVAAVNSSEIEVRVGFTHGQLLCGEVGSRERREFTVMGNAVNLAARLMAKAAAGAVLMDSTVRTLLSEFCVTREERLALKGVGDAVSVYEFLQWRSGQQHRRAVDHFYGRSVELEWLNGWWTARPADTLSCLEITGEAGAGKTELLAQFLQKLDNIETIYLDATRSALQHAGWLIGEILQAVGGEVDACAGLPSIVSTIDPRWQPLLAPLFGIETAESSWTRGLSSELRLEKTADIVASLLRNRLEKKIVVVDSLDHSDSLSRLILDKVLARIEDAPGNIILIGIQLRVAAIASKKLMLSPLATPVLKDWLSNVLVAGKREEELISRIAESSRGNPLLVQSTLNSLISIGALRRLSDAVKYEVVAPVSTIVLHHRLEDLLVARYDALTESERMVLRLVAVHTAAITTADLQRFRSEWESKALTEILERLVGQEFLKVSVTGDGSRSFTFASAQLRESVYSRIPVLELRPWHRALGEHLEAQAETSITVLAHHFAASDDAVKAFRYSLRAARQAERTGALIEAATHYQHCAARIDEVEPVLDVAECSEFFRCESGFAVHEGDFRRAFTALRRWRKLARRNQEREQCLEAAIEFARTLWKQSRYTRCREALRHINRELALSAPEQLISESLAIEGELLRRTGKIREAQEVCQRAAELARAAGDDQREITALNNLGLAYWSGGNLESARACFERTLSYGDEAAPLYLQGRVANNLAIVHEELGDFQKARQLADRARSVFVQTGDRRNQSYAAGNLANLLFQSGRYRESTDLFESADRIFLHLGEKHPHFYTIGNLGDIDLHLGRLEAAEARYRAVADYARECGDDELAAETSVRLADCIFYRGDSQVARRHYQHAIELAATAGAKEYQIRGTVGLCRLLIGLKQPDEAQLQLEVLLGFAEETHSDRNKHEAVFLSAEVARLRGSTADALNDLVVCRDYSASQGQFELNLKSLVRLCEHAETHERSITTLALLLEKFVTDNGHDLFNLLLASAYYRYFSRTLQLAASRMSLGRAPLTIA